MIDVRFLCMTVTIKEIYIQNFKKFKTFSLQLNPTLNILVGDNEAGKSTILEAINLTLTGMLNGKFLRNELSQYIFNAKVVETWLAEVECGSHPALPEIIIELYFDSDEFPILKGNGNKKHEDQTGVGIKIAFDEKYQSEYETLLSRGNVKTLPIEYYDIYCYSFARAAVTPKNIPIKPALIDSSSARFQNGSDVYISKIVKDLLEDDEQVSLIQAYRKARESFAGDESITAINTKIQAGSKISDRNVKIDIDLPARNAWEFALMTYLDDIPFHFIGKGEQSIVKTKLALSHKKTQEANILLLEEPENHLSHTNLNTLIQDIVKNNEESDNKKQIIITTHSSFVANKLGLDFITVLNAERHFRLNDLSADTKTFFSKLAGYDTLRLILCKKAILVEGGSDELVVQRAYMDTHDNRLPIEDGIDVISVGTSFLRFLEIAEKIEQPVSVMTDNDGDVEALSRKYANYLGDNQKDNIKICFDTNVAPALSDGTQFNNNTLEPTLFRANGREILNRIFGTSYDNDTALLKYMHNNKTDCALRIFQSEERISYPEYIKSTFA